MEGSDGPPSEIDKNRLYVRIHSEMLDCRND